MPIILPDPSAPPVVVPVPPPKPHTHTGLVGLLTKFFGPPPKALEGYTNAAEKLQSLVLSAIVWAITTGGGTFLESIKSHIGDIVPNPSWAALIVAIITFLADQARRAQQGTPVNVVTVPHDKPPDPNSPATFSNAA